MSVIENLDSDIHFFFVLLFWILFLKQSEYPRKQILLFRQKTNLVWICYLHEEIHYEDIYRKVHFVRMVKSL